jgi:hypothetical protein
VKILEFVFRLYVNHQAFERTISFYERLQNQRCERRVHITETGVTAAKVEGFLIFAGRAKVLAPVRDVGAIVYVVSFDEFGGGCLRTAQSCSTRRERSLPAGTSPSEIRTGWWSSISRRRSEIEFGAARSP